MKSGHIFKLKVVLDKPHESQIAILRTMNPSRYLLMMLWYVSTLIADQCTK